MIAVNTLLQEHEAIMFAAQLEAACVVASYDLAVPLEIAPRRWREALAQEEARRGIRLIKFFRHVDQAREGIP